MCTAITLQSQGGETFFGRNMDFSYDIEPHLYVVPPNYEWNNILNMHVIRNHFGFIGIGQEKDGMLGFFDGVNERGFAAAALYFADYAQYEEYNENNMRIVHMGKNPVNSWDFLHYILGRCSDIEGLKELIQNTYLIGMPDPVTETVAPLHWVAADRSGKSIIIEQTKRGLELFDNEIGVMANSPDYQWQMINLRNYMNVSPKQIPEAWWGNTRLSPFGQAGGTMLLPGGYTSPERFVRTAFIKTHIALPGDEAGMVMTCFHAMESVSIPKGVVMTGRDTYDYTKYTAFINTATCEYYFKVYDNIQIGTAGYWENCSYSTDVVDLGTLMRPVIFEKLYPC